MDADLSRYVGQRNQLFAPDLFTVRFSDGSPRPDRPTFGRFAAGSEDEQGESEQRSSQQSSSDSNMGETISSNPSWTPGANENWNGRVYDLTAFFGAITKQADESLEAKIYAVDALDGHKRWVFEPELNPEEIDERHLQGMVSSPIVVDGTVYVGFQNGTVYALEASDGQQKWTFDTGGPILSSPTVVGGTVYIGSTDQHLYALDAEDGTEKWRFKTGSEVISPACVVDDVLLYPSRNHLYALDAAAGTELWSFATDVEEFSSFPTVSRGTVYVGANERDLYALDVEDGTEKWTADIGGRVVWSPSVADGVLYVASADQQMYALDPTDGTEYWKFDAGSSLGSPPLVADDTVYVGVNDRDDGGSKVYALDASQGDEIWSSNIPGVQTPPTVVGQTLYVCFNPVVYALDTKTGDRKWTLELSTERPIGAPISSVTVVEDPNAGDSIDARVNLGLFGHHERWAEAVSSTGAKLDASTGSPSVGEQVDFTGELAGGVADEYRWTFGDGTSTRGKQATHTYQDAGVYTVELTVVSENGEEHTRERTLRALPQAEATLEVSDTEPWVGQAVDCEATLDGADLQRFEWSFGDGGAATGRTVTHRYALIDVFDPEGWFQQDAAHTVRLRAHSEAGGVYTAEQSVKVSRPPVEIASRAFDEKIYVGEKVDFEASLQESSADRFLWSFEGSPLLGGDVAGEGPGISEVFASSDASRPVVVQAFRVFDAQAPVGYLAPNGANSDVNTWPFSVEDRESGASSSEIPVLLSEGLEYFRVFSLVDAIEVDPVQPTMKDAVQFRADVEPARVEEVRWSFGDGRGSFENAPSHTYDEPGTYTVELRVNADDGDTYIGSRELEVVKLDLGIFASEPTVGQRIAMVVTGPQSSEFHWDFGNGDDRTTEVTSIWYAYEEPGEYPVTVSVTSPEGTEYTVEERVRVVDPAFSISPSRPNAGETVEFHAFLDGAEAATYRWSFGDGATTGTTGPKASHKYETSGTYRAAVDITDQTGSTHHASREFHVRPGAEGPTVYVGHSEYHRHLAAVDVASEELVELETNPRSAGSSSPTALAGTIFVGADDGKLAALKTATGRQVWLFETSNANAAMSSPTVVYDTVYVQTDAGAVYALDRASGELQWSFREEAEGDGPAIVPSPAVADGRVHVAVSNDVLYTLDAATGEKQWTAASITPSSSPTVAAGSVYVGTADGAIHALDAEDGARQWTFSEPTSSVRASPTVVDGVVYTGADDAMVYAIDAATGEREWSFETDEQPVRSSPTFQLDILWVGAGVDDGTVYALDGHDGSQRWRVDIGEPVRSSPTVYEGTVYIGSDEPKLYALRASDGYEKWSVSVGGDELPSSPTVVEDPESGHSVGTRVKLGTLGHHHEWADAPFPAPDPRVDWHPVPPEHAVRGSSIDLVLSGSAPQGGEVCVREPTERLGDSSEDWCETLDGSGSFEVSFTVLLSEERVAAGDAIELRGELRTPGRLVETSAHTLDVTAAEEGVTVEITGTNEPVAPGQALRVRAYLINHGSSQTSVPTELLVDEEAVGEPRQMNVSGSSSEIHEWNWSPTEENAGSRQVRVQVGEGDSLSADTVEVRVAKPSIEVVTEHPHPHRVIEFRAEVTGAEAELFEYEWAMGDGTTLRGREVSHHYDDEPGPYDVELTVTTPSGTEVTTTETLAAPAIDRPGARIPGDQPVAFSVRGLGAVYENWFDWEFDYEGPGWDGDETTFSHDPTVSHEFYADSASGTERTVAVKVLPTADAQATDEIIVTRKLVVAAFTFQVEKLHPLGAILDPAAFDARTPEVEFEVFIQDLVTEKSRLEVQLGDWEESYDFDSSLMKLDKDAPLKVTVDGVIDIGDEPETRQVHFRLLDRETGEVTYEKQRKIMVYPVPDWVPTAEPFQGEEWVRERFDVSGVGSANSLTYVLTEERAGRDQDEVAYTLPEWMPLAGGTILHRPTYDVGVVYTSKDRHAEYVARSRTRFAIPSLDLVFMGVSGATEERIEINGTLVIQSDGTWESGDVVDGVSEQHVTGAFRVTLPIRGIKKHLKDMYGVPKKWVDRLPDIEPFIGFEYESNVADRFIVRDLDRPISSWTPTKKYAEVTAFGTAGISIQLGPLPASIDLTLKPSFVTTTAEVEGDGAAEFGAGFVITGGVGPLKSGLGDRDAIEPKCFGDDGTCGALDEWEDPEGHEETLPVTGLSKPDFLGSDTAGTMAMAADGGMQALAAESASRYHWPSVASDGETLFRVWEQGEATAPHDGTIYGEREAADSDDPSSAPIGASSTVQRRPDVATGSAGRSMAVWLQSERSPEALTDMDFLERLRTFEVVYALHDGDAWGEVRRVTDGEQIHRAPRIAHDGTDWCLAWTELRDADYEPNVVYTRYDGGFGTFERIEQAREPRLAARPEGGVTLGYRLEEETNGDARAVLARDTGAIQQLATIDEDPDRFDVAPDQMMWLRDGALHRTTEKTNREIPVEPPADIRELTAIGRPEECVAVYQTGGRGDWAAVSYTRRTGGTWRPIRTLLAADRSRRVRADAHTLEGDKLRSTFVSENLAETGAGNKLWSETTEFRPDLQVEAELRDENAGNVKVGNKVTVQYTVHNVGDAPVPQTFEVALTDGSEVMERTEHGAPGVGGADNGSFATTVPDTGVLMVVADPDDELSQRDAGDGFHLLRLQEPELAITSLEDRRSDGEYHVDVMVTDTGDVRLDTASLELSYGDRSVASTGVPVEGDEGAQNHLQLTCDAEEVAGPATVTCAVSGNYGGDQVTSVFGERELTGATPNLRLPAGAATNRVRDGEPSLELLVENTGLGPADADIRVAYQGEQLANVTETFDYEGSPGKTVKTVHIGLPPAPFDRGERMTVDVEAELDVRPAASIHSWILERAIGEQLSIEVTGFELGIADREDGTLRIRVWADGPLEANSLAVELEGPEKWTVEEFTQQSGSGEYLYETTAPVEGDGTYSANLIEGRAAFGRALTLGQTDTVVLDRSPPSIEMTAPGHGAVVQDSEQRIALTVEDTTTGVEPDTIRVGIGDSSGDGHNLLSDTGPGDSPALAFDEQTLTVDPAAADLSFHDGPVEVRVDLRDRAGNRTKETWSFTVDTNLAPELDLTVKTTSPVAGQPVEFDATTAEDPDGEIVSYEWDLLGDGDYETTTDQGTLTHTYKTAGTYEPRARVTDDDGATATATATVTVEQPRAKLAVDAISIPNVTDSEQFAAEVAVRETAGIRTEDHEVSLTIEGPSETVYEAAIDAPAIEEETITVTFGEAEGTAPIGPVPSPEHSYVAAATARASNAVTAISEIKFGVAPAPNAIFTHRPERPQAGAEVHLDASESSAEGGAIDTYRWQFDDGTVVETEAPRVAHAYETTGEYDVTLTVTDGRGHTARTTRTVIVEFPAIELDLVETNAPILEGDTLRARFEATDSSGPERTETVVVEFGETRAEREVTVGGEQSSDTATVRFDTEAGAGPARRKLRVREPSGRVGAEDGVVVLGAVYPSRFSVSHGKVDHFDEIRGVSGGEAEFRQTFSRFRRMRVRVTTEALPEGDPRRLEIRHHRNAWSKLDVRFVDDAGNQLEGTDVHGLEKGGGTTKLTLSEPVRRFVAQYEKLVVEYVGGCLLPTSHKIYYQRMLVGPAVERGQIVDRLWDDEDDKQLPERHDSSDFDELD